jgi:hypothetical protein
MIMVKIEMQWDRFQIRVSGRVGGTTQIRVLKGPLYSFLIFLFFIFLLLQSYTLTSIILQCQNAQILNRK